MKKPGKIPCPVCQVLFNRMGMATHVKYHHPKWGGKKFKSALTQYYDRLHKQSNTAGVRSMRGEIAKARRQYRHKTREEYVTQMQPGAEEVETVEVKASPSDYRRLRERIEELHKTNAELVSDHTEAKRRHLVSLDQTNQLIRLLISEYESACSHVRRLEFVLKTVGVKLMPKHLPSVLGDVTEEHRSDAEEVQGEFRTHRC